MNAKKLSSILKKVNLPTYFRKKGRLAYYTVSLNGYIILIGIFLDSSIDPDVFHVQYFIQPLFCPFETYIFNFGKRILSHLEESKAHLIEIEISKFHKLSRFGEILNLIKSKYYGTTKEYFHLSAGFIHFICGDIKSAKNEISEILKFSKEIDSNPPQWRIENIEKAKEILLYIEKGELHLYLKKWQDYTIKSLRLEKELMLQ